MASSVDPMRGSDRTAMERFSDGGMALLPWTKQILSVLWEQLRLLVHVIYYSFLSVFQMFRFEVHLRITDETGQHVQHMSSTTNPTESFLFSSLFDGENSVIVGGSNPLSSFCADGDSFSGSSQTGGLLSSLRAEELCCGLVDDFVSRAADCFPNNDDHPSWKLGFPGDWNIFLTSSDSSGTDEACYKHTENFLKSKGKDRGLNSSKYPDQASEEFDTEDSKVLWESLSSTSDPYNPIFFSTSIPSTSEMGKTTEEKKGCSDPEYMSSIKVTEHSQGPHVLNFWTSRSDSESSTSSWGSSDGSCADLDKEESERLWELFSSPEDPYNPLSFTASVVTTTPHQDKSPVQSVKTVKGAVPSPSPKSDTDTEDKETGAGPLSSEEDEEEQLWRSLSQNNDPYHPLNFRACLQSSPTTTNPPKFQTGGYPDTLPFNPKQKPSPEASKEEIMAHIPQKTRPTKPTLPKRNLKKHSHRATVVETWRRPGAPGVTRGAGKQEGLEKLPQKKVQFLPLVQVHVMRTWPFARQASRKGHWEELARDRARFQRRIQEAEDVIGYCLNQSHREKIQTYLASMSTTL